MYCRKANHRKSGGKHMIIEFHFAGENRKKLAWVVAMIIGTTAEYQYMPTCAYKIGE